MLHRSTYSGTRKTSRRRMARQPQPLPQPEKAALCQSLLSATSRQGRHLQRWCLALGFCFCRHVAFRLPPSVRRVASCLTENWALLEPLASPYRCKDESRPRKICVAREKVFGKCVNESTRTCFICGAKKPTHGHQRHGSVLSFSSVYFIVALVLVATGLMLGCRFLESVRCSAALLLCAVETKRSPCPMHSHAAVRHTFVMCADSTSKRTGSCSGCS